METIDTNPKSMHKSKWFLLVVLVIVLVVVLGGVAVWHKYKEGSFVNSSGYQAVFLTNGQVYFGKLSGNGHSWIKLSDIYYLQVTQPLQQTANTDQSKTATPSTGSNNNQSQSNIQLVKLGSELHGPQDTMYIESDKVLFWENMKDDSKVVEAIKQYKNK